jgi:hypothetical protein
MADMHSRTASFCGSNHLFETRWISVNPPPNMDKYRHLVLRRNGKHHVALSVIDGARHIVQ